MNLCLGTVQFGMDYGVQGAHQPSYDKVYQILDYAIDNGITQFDTASAYGEAEAVLGEYIRTDSNISRNMHIVSKLNPTAFERYNKSEWLDVAIHNAEESLERLGINHFSAYLFHNASYIFNEEAVRALYHVKKSGLTDKIGVSVYTSEEAMKALEYDEIKVIQVPYNVFDRRLDKCGFFDRAIERRVKVYARSSLLQGLVMMDAYNLPDRVSFAREYIERYDSICREYNVSKLDTAIGYVSHKRGISYVVFGVDNISQMKEYIALEKTTIPEELIQNIDKQFDTVPEKLVNPVMWK